MNRLRRLIAPALFLTPFLAGAQAPRLQVDESAVRFSFPAGHFLAAIPIANPGGSASAQVAVELMDPKNLIRSHGAATCSLHTATTVCNVTLPAAAANIVATSTHDGDDLAALRIRYTVTVQTQQPVTGILSLDHIAPALYLLHIATPDRIRLGGSYTVRIRATHPLTQAPQPGVALDAEAAADIDGIDKSRLIERTRLVTDRNGFATFQFNAPSTAALSSVGVSIEGHLANLYTRVTQDISVPKRQSLTITTDKPLYQPGQTAHFRLLGLDQRGHAKPNVKLTLDVRDPDRTLIYRTEATTSHFGIATADWAIPARLRLGNYTISADSDSEEGGGYRDTEAQTQVRVSRYDLPNFTVVSKPDKPFYLRGQNAAVEVRAEYLFGKPVVHGHVRVVRETERQWNFEKQKYDVKEGAVYTGELGPNGGFIARVDLAEDEKDYRKSGEPENNAFTDLHLAAYVTDDSTGRTEQRRFDLRVTAQPLHIHFFRDIGAAEGLPIPAYISVTTAAGEPAANAHVSVALLPCSPSDSKLTLVRRAAGAVPIAQVSTNSFGLARLDTLPTYDQFVKRTPPGDCELEQDIESDPDLLITARTPDARTGRIVESLEETTAPFHITTDHTLYKPGEPILVTITSTHPSLPIHLQLLRFTSAGLVTLDTQNLTLHDGRATLTVASGSQETPNPRFTGYLTLSAVALGNKDDDIASRTVFFPRDNSLHVDVKLAHETYRPGDTASAAIDIKGPQDLDGDDTSPARTALGIVAVDQAVNERNRSDNEFGNGNSFFFPWRPLFYSARQVAGMNLADIERLDPDKPFNPDLELAAAVLLDYSVPHIEVTDDTNESPDQTFKQFFDLQFASILKTLNDYLKTHPDAPTTIAGLDDLLAAQKLSLSSLRDPWGRPYHLVATPNYGNIQLQVRSDGPDKQPGTIDDFNVSLTTWSWFARHESDLRRVLIDYHQRTGGFIRDLPTLTAAMQADHIDFTSWRDPWDQPFTWTFAINQADYTVSATTQGAPPDHKYIHRNSFEAGSASISWFTDERVRIQTALSTYTVNHPFPTTEAELKGALDDAGLSLGKFADPWGHPLYATLRTRSIFTDRISVEARAHAGQTPKNHTTVTPITALVDTVDLRSSGPDGKRGDKDSEDDFTAASFSHVRSQQSAKESAPQKTNGATQSGRPGIETGAIIGTVSDATGAVIPNIAVVATNAATQEEFETKTDESGQYELSPLPAGLYTVRFKAQGFQTTLIDEIHVLSPDATVLDAKLQVGSATETIEVDAGSVMLETNSAEITSKMILQLPFASVATISSGVMRRGFIAPPPPPPSSTPRIRDYFPETLLWRPEVLTDTDGTATIRFPVADNITTWQLSVAASTLGGNTGAGMASFQTFLPFFASLDPPQVLTTGDRIALPITLRNYLDHPVKVRSELTASNVSSRPESAPFAPPNVSSRPKSAPLASPNLSSRPKSAPFADVVERPTVKAVAQTPWLRIDTPPAAITVPAQDSASPIATITAVSPILSGKLLFTARPEGDTGDSIERPVTVHPDGLEAAVTTAGIVSGPTTFSLTIPANILPGSSDATLKLYPNLSAHLRDALVAMAAYPDGCAEQIISIAWPSLLLQRYASKLPKPDKQLNQQTRLKLAAAYANLLANRDSDGGFRYWPNDKQPDLALTAYAIQFLTAAREFTAVDDDIIKSAIAYLAQHQSSGLWMRIDRENKPHPEDTAGNAMLTASIAAMISGAPDADPLIVKALAATQPFTDSIDEPYTLANYALAAIAVGDSARSKPAITRLQTLALSENGGAYWNLETNTPFFGWGRAGRVETTAATLRALLASGIKPNADLITRGLLFLDHQQDRQSLWYSTQATARTLDVLAAIALGSPNVSSRPKSALHADAVERPTVKSGSITVRIDGQSIATTALPPPDKDAGPLFIPLGAALAAGTHKITLDLPTGSSPATAQIVANLYQPWPSSAATSATTNNEQLRLSVAFDNKSAKPSTPIHATAHIERLGFRGYGMLIAEIGLPPGADVDRASLETAVETSGYTLNHYEVLPDKLLLYLWPNAGGYDLHFIFSLRYAIDALTAPSAVYDYYNPDARLDVPPQRFTSGVSF